MRNTLCEQMFSASPPNSDIPRCGWHFAFVPETDSIGHLNEQTAWAGTVLYSKPRQELESCNGECCRIAHRAIMINILKKDLLSLRRTLGYRLADPRVQELKAAGCQRVFQEELPGVTRRVRAPPDRCPHRRGPQARQGPWCAVRPPVQTGAAPAPRSHRASRGWRRDADRHRPFL